MDYLSVKEIAELWGVSIRMVELLPEYRAGFRGQSGNRAGG